MGAKIFGICLFIGVLTIEAGFLIKFDIDADKVQKNVGEKFILAGLGLNVIGVLSICIDALVS